MLIYDSPYLLPIPAAWEEPLRSWELYLVAEGKAARTVDTRIRHLRSFARALDVPPSTVSTNEIVVWAGSHQWSPETRHAWYSSLRLFYRWYSPQARIDDPASNLRSIHRVTPPPRPVPEDIIGQALQDCAPRTHLILRLAAELGLRAKEISQLHSRDFETHVSRLVQPYRPRKRRLPTTPASCAFPGR